MTSARWSKVRLLQNRNSALQQTWNKQQHTVASGASNQARVIQCLKYFICWTLVQLESSECLWKTNSSNMTPIQSTWGSYWTEHWATENIWERLLGKFRRNNLLMKLAESSCMGCGCQYSVNIDTGLVLLGCRILQTSLAWLCTHKPRQCTTAFCYAPHLWHFSFNLSFLAVDFGWYWIS